MAESDFHHRDVIEIKSINGNMFVWVDFSYSDEEPGFIRVSELNGLGDMFYVPNDNVVRVTPFLCAYGL